jgi:ubiquinone/menaquinone biosynthesis C-methylase UbiE
VPEEWAWDESLFAGSSVFYDRGRIPYPVGLRDAFANVADLRGSPRLIDVGCGPGTVALRLADLFAEVVGVDADRGMIEEATRLATRRKLTNARWLRLRAEALPAGLGTFRYATFAQSFHWMDRELVATRVFVMLEPGGAFVHVGGQEIETPPPSSRFRIRCRRRVTSGVSSSRTSASSDERAREYYDTGRPATSGRSCRRRASKRRYRSA